MRKIYKRPVYLLDNGFLFFGYKDKYGFHPERALEWTFFKTRKVSKKNIGKTLFYSFKDAVNKLDEIKICGGTFYIAIDAGSARTKMALGDKCGSAIWFETSTLYDKTDESLKKLLSELYLSLNITMLANVEVRPKIIDPVYASYKGPIILDRGYSTIDYITKNKEEFDIYELLN